MSEHTVSRHRLIAYDRNKQVFEFDFQQSRFNASERFFNEYGGQNDPARRLNSRHQGFNDAGAQVIRGLHDL